MKLRPVDYRSYDDVVMLFDLLAERTAEQSISHREMPTWERHCAFVQSRPYLYWYVIGERYGAIYLSKRREIGVGVFEQYQRRGVGIAAVEEIMRLHPGAFLANINPGNEASRRLWEKLGFTVLQVTYAK